MTARAPRGQRGLALPAPVILLSAVAVILAAVAFFVTRNSGSGNQVDLTGAQPTHSPTVSAQPKVSRTPTAKPTKKALPPVNRSSINVVVYNNTHLTGLAGTVGAKVQSAGWHFVGTGNWHGTIPATTIYYGAGLKRAAHQLSLDLGVSRTYPAATGAAGMLPHGLTLILLGPVQ